MKNNPSGMFGNLYKIVKDFLADFYTESKKVTTKHAKGVTVFLSFLVLCFLIFVAAAYKISETSFFCGTCHNMKVYVDSWKASKHKHVACIECHYKPGFMNHLKGKWQDGQLSLAYFITGKRPTKPHAEIDDASCLQSGCHKKEDLKNELVFKNVIFSHLHHLDEMKRGKQLRCTTCHSQIVQGAHITVTDVECFICHFYKSKGQKEYVTGCTSCHFEAKGDIKVGNYTFNHTKYIKRGVKCETCHTNVVTGDGHIQENACLQCHNRKEILEAKYTPEFLHKNHVTVHKVECFTCHSAIKHATKKVTHADIEKTSDECLKCHNQGQHGSEVLMYLGKGARFVQDTPSRKAMLGIDCNVCHVHAKGEINPGNRCGVCHGALTEGMVEGWKKKVKQNDITREMNELKGIMQRKDTDDKTRHSVENIIHNNNLVVKGNPVHNILYSTKILYQNKGLLTGLKGQPAGEKQKARQYAVSCNDLCHGNISEKKIPFGKVSFLHEIHAEGEGSCLKCHTAYTNHGNTVLKDCSKCHHSQGTGKVTCVDCHKNTQVMLKNKNSIHGKLSCTDCHAPREGKKENISEIKGRCMKCHKKHYADKTDEWIARGSMIAGQYRNDMAAFDKEIAAIELKEQKHSVPLRKVYDDIYEDMQLLIAVKYAHNPAFGEAMVAKTKNNMIKLNQMIKDKKEGRAIVAK